MSDDADQGRTPAAPITRAWLDRAALHYLERYASSSANLARVLGRKVERRAKRAGMDPAPFLPLVDEAVARLVSLGLVNDRAFAEAKLASLRRRGTSARMIAAKLAGKGVPREIAEETLSGDTSDETDAARALARRRRLGPFRPGADREAHRLRDLAALARAGFSYEVARAAIDGAAEDESAASGG